MATAFISVLSPDPVRHAESLTDWLRGEPALTGRVRPVGGAPVEGHLGVPLDTVSVLLGAGGPLTVLASCLRAWITQPRRSDVKLSIRREHGPAIEIDARRVDGEDLARLLRQALDEHQDPRA
ncbi:effector-associated constant component EACC1 [Streptomyces humi]|uniref:effector-associated constant component EACC1 n=1 Tax=Streptomyces humi TaxID=1428620 RepID=UPI0009A10130|nr:hypothetical protein [Streptomyces humi]